MDYDKQDECEKIVRSAIRNIVKNKILFHYIGVYLIWVSILSNRC